MKEIDKVKVFKEVMRNYPTGVTIVTALDKDDQPIGLTANSFASVSLDPLLVLWSIDHKVSTFNEFAKADKFAIHILTGEQTDLCKLFSSKNKDRFANCNWSLSENSLPIIANTCSVLQCRTFNKIEAGDHLILIGEVFAVDHSNQEPMLYIKRNFGQIPNEFYI